MNNECVIGIDLGGTNIKGALLDLNGEIIEKKETPTLSDAGPEAVVNRIGGMITELEDLARRTGNRVAGVGIGVPGQPEREKGEVIFAPNLYWRNVPLAKYLYRNTGLPIFLENDANVAALGEHWRGAGRGSVNMVMVTIGTGIGSGIILNGQLYTGASGAAGELGHVVIESDGPQCSCGRRGCLETLTSATAMVRMAREAMDSGIKTVLSKEENLEAKDIIMAARDGDRLALEIAEKSAYYLGIGLGNIINILNPDTIVIGGGVSGAGHLFLDPLCRAARDNCLETAGSIVRIAAAQLGNDAGFVGAAKLVLEVN
ncbi:ROK family protein [Phosphitispora sp. TUW77]|uniref:ROK family protein n=1 Tax=Phosphitispora sp. TUW77 TaxID=3152361 RepID=UPI003AB28548